MRWTTDDGRGFHRPSSSIQRRVAAQSRRWVFDVDAEFERAHDLVPRGREPRGVRLPEVEGDEALHVVAQTHQHARARRAVFRRVCEGQLRPREAQAVAAHAVGLAAPLRVPRVAPDGRLQELFDGQAAPVNRRQAREGDFEAAVVVGRLAVVEADGALVDLEHPRVGEVEAHGAAVGDEDAVAGARAPEVAAPELERIVPALLQSASLLDAHLVQRARRVAPALLDLDEEFEVDPVPHEPLDVLPRGRPYLLEARAALPDDDALLRRALDVDGAVDARQLVRDFLVTLGDDRRHVGYLLARHAQNLLAHHLGDERAHRLVGQLVLAEDGLALGEVPDE